MNSTYTRAMNFSTLFPLVAIKPMTAPMAKASANAQTAVSRVLPSPSRKLSRWFHTVAHASHENKPDMVNAPFP